MYLSSRFTSTERQYHSQWSLKRRVCTKTRRAGSLTRSMKERSPRSRRARCGSARTGRTSSSPKKSFLRRGNMPARVCDFREYLFLFFTPRLHHEWKDRLQGHSCAGTSPIIIKLIWFEVFSINLYAKTQNSFISNENSYEQAWHLTLSLYWCSVPSCQDLYRWWYVAQCDRGLMRPIGDNHY